jgi:hypothetical protein
MADGLLGKCKECTKSDVHANYHNKIEQFHEYESKRNRRPERKAQLYAATARRRRRRPEQKRAWDKVAQAKRTGKLVSASCSFCGATRKIEAHHDDYQKPLDVKWVCFKCHREREHGQKVTAQ